MYYTCYTVHSLSVSVRGELIHLQGQFYGVTLEYRSNPAESITEDLSNVKSVVMLVFRDAKNPDDELNAWEFWHQVRMDLGCCASGSVEI